MLSAECSQTASRNILGAYAVELGRLRDITVSSGPGYLLALFTQEVL